MPEETTLIAREYRAPPTSKPKSPLPHLRKAETESFLQPSETEESFISTKQTGPSNFTRKMRAPLTPQLATRGCLSLLVRERDPVGREYTLKKKRWSFPQPSNRKVWSSPQRIERKNKSSTSCSETRRASFPSFFVVAGESFFLAESSFASWFVASQS